MCTILVNLHNFGEYASAHNLCLYYARPAPVANQSIVVQHHAGLYDIGEAWFGSVQSLAGSAHELTVVVHHTPSALAALELADGRVEPPASAIVVVVSGPIARRG